MGITGDRTPGRRRNSVPTLDVSRPRRATRGAQPRRRARRPRRSRRGRRTRPVVRLARKPVLRDRSRRMWPRGPHRPSSAPAVEHPQLPEATVVGIQRSNVPSQCIEALGTRTVACVVRVAFGHLAPPRRLLVDAPGDQLTRLDHGATPFQLIENLSTDPHASAGSRSLPSSASVHPPWTPATP